MKDDIKRWIKEDGQKFLMEIGIKKGQTILDFGSGEGHYRCNPHLGGLIAPDVRAVPAESGACSH